MHWRFRPRRHVDDTEHRTPFDNDAWMLLLIFVVGRQIGVAVEVGRHGIRRVSQAESRVGEIGP
jgi:hypothetical protein